MSSVEEFVAWVKATSVKAVIPHRQITSAPSDASLMAVLDQLRSLKVHSLPVVHSGRGTVLGMVDVLDIVCAVYDLAELDRFNKDGSFDAGDVAASFINLKPLEEKLAGTNASRMIRKAAPARSDVIATLPASFDGPEMPNYNVTVDDSVYDLLAKLGWGAIHRVPVLAPAAAGADTASDGGDSISCDGDSTHEMVDVICQSDLLRFLSAHMDKLPADLLATPISKYATTTLCKVPMQASMAEALWLFKQRKVLSLVVEDNNGGFVGSISAQDFILRASDLSIYGMAIDEFLGREACKATVKATVASTNALANSNTNMLPSTTTLGETIAFLAERRQYRVWMTDGDQCAGSQRPIVTGVLSIRDIIKALWKSAPENVRAQVCQD